MASDLLQRLDFAAGLLAAQPAFQEETRRLKLALRDSHEPFVWSVVDLASLADSLPPIIRSAWIFVLKQDQPSGAHYHPNSVQHMVMLEGTGRSRVDGEEREMPLFRAPGRAPEETWYVIRENTPHEFFPRGMDMVVVSFHTCSADELQEIACDTGAMRTYETR